MLQKLSRNKGVRYDSSMSRIAVAVISSIFVLCASVEATSAAGRSSALLFAADVASDASKAASEAASQTGGRVLDVKKRLHEGRPVFDVKVLLDDGRVKVIQLEGTQDALREPSGE